MGPHAHDSKEVADIDALLAEIARGVGGNLFVRETLSAFSPFPTTLALSEQSAMLAVACHASATWSNAGLCRAQALVIVDPGRAAHFLNLIVLGLFSITAGPDDFVARLTSVDAGSASTEPFNAKLLEDTTHHVARALNEHLGRRLSEAEKAIVFETLWRHAGARDCGRDSRGHFLSDTATYRWLEKLVRGNAVYTVWGDARMHLVSDDVRQILAARERALELVCIGSRGAAALFDPNAWQRVRRADDCRALLGDAVVPYATLLTQPTEPLDPDARGEREVSIVEATLAEHGALSAPGLLLAALEIALARPHQAILTALLHNIRAHHEHLAEVATPRQKYLLDLCGTTMLHDDDPSWRRSCAELLRAQADLAPPAANLLAHALGLFA